MMKYKHIIFDFGNVIVTFGEKQIIGPICPSPEDSAIMKHAIFHAWDDLDRGTIDYEEYMEHAASLAPERLRPNIRQFAREWCLHLTPLEETWELIHDLKKKGFSLYILSNASAHFAAHADYYEITKEFDGIVFSAPVQMMKPEPDIYRYLFETYHLNPEECFFLDDKEENVRSGNAFGMDGIVFTGNVAEVRKILDV